MNINWDSITAQLNPKKNTIVLTSEKFCIRFEKCCQLNNWIKNIDYIQLLKPTQYLMKNKEMIEFIKNNPVLNLTHPFILKEKLLNQQPFTNKFSCDEMIAMMKSNVKLSKEYLRKEFHLHLCQCILCNAFNSKRLGMSGANEHA